jgi:hypothetical protein
VNQTRIACRCLAVAAFSALALRSAGGSNTWPPIVYGKLPLAFEPNRGQADRAVRFVARGSGYSLLLSDHEAILVLAGRKAVVRLQWIGPRRQTRVEGRDRLPGVSNYFLGNDPARWRTDIPQFGRVKFSGVYPGIDLVYYGKQRQLEYDAILAPHADPRQLRLRIRGAERIRISPEGDLVLSVPGGEIFQRKPQIYQMQGQSRRQIAGRYELRAGGEVGFAVARYDAGKPLIIDPALNYATYLGGLGSDEAWAVAVDSSGNVYVTGDTTSTDFPTVGNPPLQTTNNVIYPLAATAFVAKLNPAGTAVLYATYLGGNDNTSGRGIAVDGYGSAYVAGNTYSLDFPVTPGAFQTAPSGGFVSKLNATGSALSYSTYVGVIPNAIAVDAAGCAYVTGSAGGGLATSATAFQQQAKSYSTAFVLKLNAAGSAEAYGTYLGGSNSDQGNGIAVDSFGNALVAGHTYSSDFPMQNPIQASLPASESGFVAALNADASALLYSTYLGGKQGTVANAVAVDGSGNAYVTGQTNVPSSETDTFPLLSAIQAIASAGAHAFLTKFSSAGALVYSTYLGGSGEDNGNGVGVDRAGNAYVTGSTASYDFPLVNALQSNLGGYDLIAVKSLDGGNTWSAGHAGEFTGMVNALVVNPAAPSTIFAGMASGRVYQSIDGGAHWSRSDAGLPGTPISSLAIAADNSAMYAGTAAGVFESTNGGLTWFAQNSGLTNTAVNAVAVDPSNANIVYAATGSGTSGALFMSTNGGGAWASVASSLNHYFTSVVIDPVTPQHVYSGTSSGLLVYSYDRFASSQSLTLYANIISRVNALAMDSSGNLYGAVAGNETLPYPRTGQVAVLCKVTGLGANGFIGTSIVDGAPQGQAGLSVAVSSSGAVYAGTSSAVYGVANTGGFVGPFQAIAADPSNADTLYIGNGGASPNAFLTVVNPAGTALLSSTYFGGSFSDAAQAIAVDTNGNAWIAGFTNSPDFPVTAGVSQARYAGGQDAFVARFFPPGPMLSVTSSHAGNFMQGQIGATYILTVSNAPGASPTGGTVTVAETVPPGMTLISMAGTGWTCPAHGTTCWCSDALNGGASYPEITVTVDVGAGAGSQLTNHAGVSWGVSASATASDLTGISPLACNVSGDGSPSVADVQLVVNQALGAMTAVDDMNNDGAVNVVDVQIVMNAALQSGCAVSAVR